MNPYEMFGTDKNLENGQGADLEYDGFTITIRRAGGANKAYDRVAAAKLRPHRRQIQMDAFDRDVQRKIMIETYAETIIIGWKGMKDAEGNDLEFSKENVIKVMTDLPDLFDDIMVSANEQKNFRAAQLKEEAKN